jgi:hypothetical protein
MAHFHWADEKIRGRPVIGHRQVSEEPLGQIAGSAGKHKISAPSGESRFDMPAPGAKVSMPLARIALFSWNLRSKIRLLVVE